MKSQIQFILFLRHLMILDGQAQPSEKEIEAMKVTALMNRKRKIEKQSKNPGKAKDFFEITPEMIAGLDTYLGRQVINEAKNIKGIFGLDDNQTYTLMMAWVNDRLRKQLKPSTLNMVPVTSLIHF